MTTTPESWEQQLRDAAHTIPDTEGMEAIRHALIDHTIRLYTALGWSVDLDPDDALARAAEMARQLDEARLELTRWQSMFGDVDTARARLDGLEALAAELRRERDEARAYAKHAVKEATAVNRRLVDELERLRAQHDRVRELHPPEEQHDRTWCAHDDHAWPCPTYTALSEPAVDTTPGWTFTVEEINLTAEETAATPERTAPALSPEQLPEKLAPHYVEPGTVYDDEPGEFVPPGWYVLGDHGHGEGADIEIKIEHAVDANGNDITSLLAAKIASLLEAFAAEESKA